MIKKRTITLLLFLIWATPFWAQTACESDYQFACDDERRNDIEISQAEARLKDLRCKKEKLAQRKQELLACAVAEKSKINTEKIKSVLIDALKEVERLQQQPTTPTKICVGGNCN